MPSKWKNLLQKASIDQIHTFPNKQITLFFYSEQCLPQLCRGRITFALFYTFNIELCLELEKEPAGERYQQISNKQSNCITYLEPLVVSETRNLSKDVPFAFLTLHSIEIDIS